MKKVLALVCCVLLVACEYEVELVSKPDTPIDQALLGRWEKRDADGKLERMLVLPLSDKEYMVSYPALSEDAMYARVCLFEMIGLKWAQVRWIGSARGQTADTGRVYQYVTYSLEKDRLFVRLLNSDTVSRDIATPDALRRAIEAHRDDPKLFRETVVYTRSK